MVPSGTTGNPYLQSAAAVARSWRVLTDEGLSTTEVKHRQKRWGTNTLPVPRSHPLRRALGDRFKDVLVLFLLAAAAISIFVGEWSDAVIIGIAILLDTALTLIQIWRTERTLRALRQKVEQITSVVRHGKIQRLPSSYLVPGDIIEFRAGEKIPADARLLTANGLRVAEAALTGESHDVAKNTARLTTRTPLGNRRNMVYMGTVVTSGSGKAVVIATGVRTEFGRIAQMLKTEQSPESPLRKKLQHTGTVIGWSIVGIILIVAVVSMLQGQPWTETARTAATLIVSAIPEDLTIILTIALTVGVVRILRQKGVVRELRSGETLGAATVICTDKTGTLTHGQMEAIAFDFLQGTSLAPATPPHDPLAALAMTGFTLATEAHRVAPTLAEYVGSATERTALQFAEAAGITQAAMRVQWRQRDSLSFSSQWMYRASLHDHPTRDSRVLFVSGAPEVLLEKSARALDSDFGMQRLTSTQRTELMQKIHSRAAAGDRLLAIAIRRNVKALEITHTDVSDLLFLGVLVIKDPVRTDVRESIRLTQSAGVAVKLVTGDYEATARAVAREVGLTVTDDAVLSGNTLSDMSNDELRDAVDRTVVFARVSPLDKQRIIHALQARGHVVAMTGDGVNDAVALKSADIGVAMGSGKDIAKDAADLVLLDDSFATIVSAIREGRVIRDNVRKVIAFLLSTNMAEVVLFIVSLLFRWPLPLLPAQILWINLVTDGTSDIALSLEPQERNVMQRRPEDPRASLLDRYTVLQIAATGLIMSAATALLYWYLISYLMLDVTYARTMVFTFLSISSLLSTWSFRSLHEMIYQRGVWQNVWISLSIGFSFMLQLLAVYAPPLQRFFNTVPLRGGDWVLILGLSAITLILIDMRKLFLKPLATKENGATKQPSARLAMAAKV